MVSKKDFMKVWKDSSRESILNQFYYEHKILQEEYNNWNELKDSLEKDIKEYEESEFHIEEPPLTIQTKIDLLLKMQELESRK